MRIIFQDIDGPLIPLRMYYRGGRPFDYQKGSFMFDPIAVDMINHVCQEFDARVVFNTAHNENPEHVMKHQGTVNGFTHLHENCTTEFIRSIDNRFEAIKEWLSRHPEVTEWIVVDDMEVHRPRQVLVDYSTGMTIHNYYNMCELFGNKKSIITGVGQTSGVNYKI